MTDANAAAAALMQNPAFMAMFEKAMGVGGAAGGAPGGAANPFAAMPPEGDPKRDAWLRDLQAKLEQEAAQEAKKQLETPITDEDGTQWMWVQPEAGFCVKCLAHVPGKGKEKVFINVCRHARVPEPIPFEDPEEPGEMKFRIPLSLGPARPDADKSGAPCRVYDVIVNPATIKRCSEEAEFRRFVAALCMMSLKQKSEPHLDADQFTNVNFKAKGQLGVQRVRLSRPVANANGGAAAAAGGAGTHLRDEIALPSSKHAPTAPVGAAGSSGMGGKMVVEVTDSTTPSASPQGSVERSDNVAAPATHIVATSGSYDWTGHAKPTRNPYFRAQVPSEIAIEVTVPRAQSAKELDTRIADGRTLQLRWIDDVADDENCEPFYTVTLDFPVDEEPLTAKFTKKSKTLTLVFKVRLPDETADEERRAATLREAAAADAAAEAARREADAKSHQAYKARVDRIEAEEREVMRQRKELVENLQAVAEGEIPPALREDVDKMPLEQARLLMARLESRTLKGDSVDVMIEKMSPDVLHAVSNYIRSRLGLEPLAMPKTAAATAHEFKQEKAAENSVEVEYNFAKKAENLFGVQMYNRYVFALEH